MFSFQLIISYVNALLRLLPRICFVLGTGDLITGTFKDRSGREPLISGSSLDEGSNWPQITTQKDIMNLNGINLYTFSSIYKNFVRGRLV